MVKIVLVVLEIDLNCLQKDTFPQLYSNEKVLNFQFFTPILYSVIRKDMGSFISTGLNLAHLGFTLIKI